MSTMTDAVAGAGVVGVLGVGITVVAAVIAAAVGAAVAGMFMHYSALFIIDVSSLGTAVVSLLLAGSVMLFGKASVALGVAMSIHPVLVGAALAALTTGVGGLVLTTACAGFVGFSALA